MKEKSVFEEDLVKSNEENDKFIQTIAQKDNEIQVKTYIYQSLGNPIFCENNFVKYCVELFESTRFMNKLSKTKEFVEPRPFLFFTCVVRMYFL